MASIHLFVTRCLSAVLLAASLALPRLAGEAQQSGLPLPPSLAAERLREGEQVVMDGELDEPVWLRAASVRGFVQRRPRERQGGPATEDTWVRVAYDAENLYVGAVLYDRTPDRVVSWQRARDALLESDDSFAIAIDPYGEERGGYLFETNPAGVITDSLLGAGDPNYAWNGLWDVRTRRTTEGWQAEFVLPLRMLNFPRDANGWAVNFRRVLRRDDEESLWTAAGEAQGVIRTRYAGRLEGLQQLTQGRGVLFTPFVVGSWKERGPASGRFSSNAGFDLTYSLTPNLRAALTVNTDFAGTEVDDRKINLGRLPLFVPEKRDFFLEGSEVFAFPGDDATRPYYSRRIGSADQGPVPLLGGARLAGQAGPLSVGALHVRTRPAFGWDAEDFTVARIRVHSTPDNYIGLLYTRRDGIEEPRQTVGLDGGIEVLDLGAGQRATTTPYAVWTEGRAASGTDFLDRSHIGNLFEWRSASLQVTHRMTQTGKAFEPAVGFTDAQAYRRQYLWIAYEYKPNFVPARSLQHAIEFNYRTDLQDRLIEGITWIGPWWQEFESGDRIDHWQYVESFTIDTPFELWPGIRVPRGRYHRYGVFGRIKTAERRWWSVMAEARHGGFYQGERTMAHVDAILRPWPGLEIEFQTQSHFVRMPEGDFVSRLHRFRLAYNLSTRHSVSVLTQFDNRSNVLGLQARLRWRIKPGADVLLSYLQDWDHTFEEPGGERVWRARGRETALKGSWSWSF